MSLKTENIEVSSAKSFTLDYRLSDKSLIYIKKCNGQIIEPRGTPVLIASHSDSQQLFVVFRIKKIRSKLEDHLLHPYTLSYK